MSLSPRFLHVQWGQLNEAISIKSLAKNPTCSRCSTNVPLNKYSRPSHDKALFHIKSDSAKWPTSFPYFYRIVMAEYQRLVLKTVLHSVQKECLLFPASVTPHSHSDEFQLFFHWELFLGIIFQLYLRPLWWPSPASSFLFEEQRVPLPPEP